MCGSVNANRYKGSMFPLLSFFPSCVARLACYSYFYKTESLHVTLDVFTAVNIQVAILQVMVEDLGASIFKCSFVSFWI